MTNTNEDRVAAIKLEMEERATHDHDRFMDVCDERDQAEFLLALMAAANEGLAEAGGHFVRAGGAAMSRAMSAEASLTAAQERVGELEKNLADVIRAYDHAIKVTVGEGGRRSWHMKAAKLAVAHDLSRALLTPTPCSQQGPGIGGES